LQGSAQTSSSFFTSASLPSSSTSPFFFLVLEIFTGDFALATLLLVTPSVSPSLELLDFT